MGRYYIAHAREAKAVSRGGIPAAAIWMISLLLVTGFAAAIPYLIDLVWYLSTPLMQLF